MDIRLETAIQKIDSYNADDPEFIEYQGNTYQKELFHSELMTKWVNELDPSATAEQLIAARANHLRRWELKRSEFPSGRAGYLKWRTQQAKKHAQLVEEILKEVGYEKDFIDRVGSIIQKKNLKSDAQVQTHEDALCLVFLATQKEALWQKLKVTPEVSDPKSKLEEILEKTLAKMSPDGIQKAQKYLDS